ncbi:ArnT family glycosyltransferase [Bryobacter aggregatus]|uniref:ArnT family glycosyltransferase n=1 Tax=Bryobacter aggregatus TaxID=360054 RepID=UPI0004E19C1C|nr:glycosyltransferase family 39 protein [Bryobacter aggregatus]
MKLVLRCVILAWILFGAWQLLQLETRTWGKDLATHPDEAAHFTSGVMVADYLRGGAGTNPVAFASEFYVHYPKVAIGHWPPFYYLVEAVWFGIAGETVSSARALVMLTALLLMAGTFWWARRDLGWTAAFAVCAVLLNLNVFRIGASEVLSDAMVAFLSMAALFFWVRYFEKYRRADLFLFSLVASAAILTKGNAWVILLAVGLAPLLAGRWRIYLDRWYWISGVLVVLLAAPFYVYAQSTESGYPTGSAQAVLQTGVIARRFQMFVAGLLPVLPPAAWALSAIGLLAGFRLREGAHKLRWAMAAAFAVSMIAFLVLSGLSFEDRVLLPVVPFLLILACQGAIALASLRKPFAVPVLLACLLLCFLPLQEFNAKPRDGYKEILLDIPASQSPRALLVLSDSIGEGAVLVHELIQDPRRRNATIRGTKFLSEQDWNGQNYRELFPEDQALLEELQKIPVTYVLIDDWSRRAETTRLRRVAAANFTLLSRRAVQGKFIELYQNPKADGRGIESLRFSLGPSHGSRMVELDPKAHQ